MYIDIQPIVNSLDGKKGKFIAQCRADIETECSNRGRRCLSIREVGVGIHDPAPDNYMKVLWKFYQGETYHGHRLESVLSGPISELVASNYSRFLEENKSEIETQLKQAVIARLDITSALEEILHDELKERGIKYVQQEAADALVSACSAVIHSQVAAMAMTTVSTAVTHTVGTALGASIAHALAGALHNAIATVLVHVAHSAALKIMLKTIIAHSVGGIVMAVLVKLIAAKLSTMSAASLLGPAALFVGGGIVYYKIKTIPEKLGKKLGEEIAASLQGDFRTWTEKALDSYVQELSDPEKVLKAVVRAEIDDYFPEIAAELVGKVPAYEAVPKDEWYDEVEKKTEKLGGYAKKGLKKGMKKVVKANKQD